MIVSGRDPICAGGNRNAQKMRVKQRFLLDVFLFRVIDDHGQRPLIVGEVLEIEALRELHPVAVAGNDDIADLRVHDATDAGNQRSASMIGESATATASLAAVPNAQAAVPTTALPPS